MSNTVVRTNVLALNSHRNLGMVGRQQANASARLSSGFRINSAADDAAGLGISEKMRSQIRGLDQASRNAQDGISLIQTAEGAMSTVNEMVTRIRELVVQASNDTNAHDPNNKAQSDRVRIQDEINQLMDEIDKTRERTQFNTRMLIDGSLGSGSITNSGNTGPIKASAAFQGTGVAATDLINLWQNGATATDITNNIKEGSSAFAAIAAVNLENGYSWVGGQTEGAKALATAFRDAWSREIGYSGSWSNIDSVALNSAVAAWISKVDSAAYAGATSTATMESTGVGTSTNIQNALKNIWDNMDVSVAIRDNRPSDRLFTVDATNGLVLETNLLTSNSIAPGDRNAAQDAARGALAAWLTANKDSYGWAGNSVQQFNTWVDANKASLFTGTNMATTITTTNGLEAFINAGKTTPATFSSIGFTERGKQMLDDIVSAINKGLQPFITGGGGSGGNGLYFQVGANERQGVRLTIEDVGTAALSRIGFRGDKKIENGFSFADLRTESEQSGVRIGKGVELVGGESISKFIVAIDEALAHVTGQRSNLGAMQNRLEYTIQNLDVSSENLSAANSRIRDADMAKEMMRLTQSNVLQQAATAMLAQANQAPQNVLQLLG